MVPAGQATFPPLSLELVLWARFHFLCVQQLKPVLALADDWDLVQPVWPNFPNPRASLCHSGQTDHPSFL